MPPTVETRTHPFSIQARYLVQVAEGGDTRPLLVGLHGQGMSAEGLLRLLDFPSRADRMLLVPEGPLPFELRRQGGRDVGYAWYLYRGDQDEFRHYLERAEQHVLGIIEEVSSRHGFDPERTVLMGFSQGGYLAGFMGLRNRHLFRGLVLAGTRLKHEFLAKEFALRDLPSTLVFHAKNDPAVSWEAARGSIDLLQQAGAAVEIVLHEEGHRLPARFGERLESWLERHGL